MKIIQKIFCVFLFTLFHFSCFAGIPAAADNSVFVPGMRIQILTPTMIRIQKEINHRYPDITDLGVVNLSFPKVHVTTTEQNGIVVIETDSMTVVFSPDREITRGGITVSMPGGFTLSSLDSSDTSNLGGVIGSLDNCKGNIHYSEQNDAGSKPAPHPIPNGILSRRGFTVLTHTPDTLYFYKSGNSWTELYVLGYGHNYKQAFSDFFSLAGSPNGRSDLSIPAGKIITKTIIGGLSHGSAKNGFRSMRSFSICAGMLITGTDSGTTLRTFPI